MSKKRADLGFTDELESFNPEDWLATSEAKSSKNIETEGIHAIAKASGFKSREPKNDKIMKKQRRRRTGRNTQFNIKAKPETIDEFCSIADSQGWGLGETLEYAVELLRDRYRK